MGSQDAENRRRARQAAEKIDAERQHFDRWLEAQGMSEAQRNEELKKADDIVRRLHEEAER